MNARFQAAWEIHQFLTKHGIAYAIIGGSALPRWGEPRFTKDVDLVAVTSLSEGAEPFLRLIQNQFRSRPHQIDPLTLARVYRMILIEAANGCDVDISLAVTAHETEVMHRAVDYELEPGKLVRVCSAEDLIVYKCVAGRPQDMIDVSGIIIRQRDALDLSYIRKWLRFFANEKPDSEILDRFERGWGAERRSLNKMKNGRSTAKKKRQKKR
jgi:hypothetical protein